MRVTSRTSEAPAIAPGFRFWIDPFYRLVGILYSDSLRGRPPPCVLRLAAIWR